MGVPVFYGLVVLTSDGKWVENFCVFSSDAKRQEAASAYEAIGLRTCRNDEPVGLNPSVEVVPPTLRFSDYNIAYSTTGDGEYDFD